MRARRVIIIIVRLQSLSPGAVLTEAIRNRQKEEGHEFLKKMPKLCVEDVVDSVLYILGTPPHVHVSLIILYLFSYPYLNI